MSSDVTLNVSYGTTSGTATQGNDTRLNPAPGTQGRVLYDSGSSWVALGTGTSGQFLQTQGASANPQWSSAVLPTRQVLAGTGLTGGGNLSADVTLTVSYGTTSGTATQGNDTRVVNAVQTSRQVLAGTGLSGGGTLASDVTLSVSYGTTSGTAAQGNDVRFSYGTNQVVNKSTTYSAALGDVILCTTTSAGFTVTLPSASTSTNRSVSVKKITGDSNIVTVVGSGTDKIDNQTNLLINSLNTAVTLWCDGTGWWIF